jgi:uncharacterized protein (UPF0548 family)
LARAEAGAPTYPEVGATRAAQLPSGYRHDVYERHIGSSDAVFSRAVSALRAWQAQVGAGVEVFPHGAQVDDASTVVLLLRAGGLWAPAPCRVIYVDAAPNSFAFAYGTLPGHPETGEVAFRIDRGHRSDGLVFRIVSFSRTADRLARLASPVTRRIQQRVTNRYLDAIADASV